MTDINNMTDTDNMTDTERCPMCPNHCMKGQTRCGRGAAYFSGDCGEHSGHGGRGHGDHKGDASGRENGYKHVGRVESGRWHHLSEPEDTLYGLMRQSGHYLFHRGQGNAAHGQDRILILLAENEEGVSQRMLQNRLGIQPGSISEILNKLEDKGMILRERDEADQRRVIVRLTESGKERAERLKMTTDSTDDLFSVLTDDEKAQLKAIMTKLVGMWLSEQ